MENNNLWFVDYSLTTGGDYVINKQSYFIGKFDELSRRFLIEAVQVHEIKYLGECVLMDSVVEKIGRMVKNRPREE